MKLFFILIGSLCYAWSGMAQSGKCIEQFKTGKFTYKEFDGSVEIIRTPNTQTEIYNDGKSSIILKIEWTSDSTYVLTHQKSINAPGCLEKGNKIYTRLVHCDGNEAVLHFTSEECGVGQTVLVKRE